jgi:carbon monoxide dehydrogenase subunit G
MRWLLVLSLITVGAVAHADVHIQFDDVAGSAGQWQEGTAVIPAPIEQVRRWLTDYDHWPQIFSDVSAASVEGTTPDGAAIVRFHSRLNHQTIVIRERQTPFGLEYEGGSTHVRVQGRIFLSDLGNGRTRVTMQSSSDVHGYLRPFVSDRLKRSRTQAMIRADMTSLFELSRRR